MKFIKTQLLFFIVDVSASTEAFFGTAFRRSPLSFAANRLS